MTLFVNNAIGRKESVESLPERTPRLDVTKTAVVLLAIILPVSTLAQRLPDPDKVAPEYRDAAEKRRQQVIRRMGCMLNADKEKVLKRDLATYINHCMESVDGDNAKR